jgi:hypothetical protein
MTSLKDQQKLLKDAGKGVVEGIKKIAEPFIKEAVGLAEAKKLLQGFKNVDTVDSEKQKKLTFGIKAANRDREKAAQYVRKVKK